MSSEWSICSRQELMDTDVLGYALISDPTYNFPQNVPEDYDCEAATVANVCSSEGYSSCFSFTFGLLVLISLIILKI